MEDYIEIKDNNADTTEDETLKVFSTLLDKRLQKNEEFLGMLELSVEQLTHYLEEEIMDNPFIEIEYSDEVFTDSLETVSDQKIKNIRTTQNLESYLFEQILLYRQTPIRDVMVQLVAFIDERGYLPYTTKEMSKKLDVPEIIVLDAMTLIKQLEPAGIGAYDLQESMMLQTERDHYAPNVAYYLLESYFEELNQEDYTEISEQTGLTHEEIIECVNYYHMLRANPASLFERTTKINVIPDITIQLQHDGRLTLTYNRQYYPRIRFNSDYYNEMYDNNDLTLRNYLKDKKESYQEITNRLRQRENLIKKMGECLIICQKDFFAGHASVPSSLSIADVSKKMRLAIPIVHRLLLNKNLAFNGHIYAFSYFINMSTTKGRTGLTTNYVKKRIKEIDEMHPGLSDQEMAAYLRNEKINISDMIVSTYRQN